MEGKNENSHLFRLKLNEKQKTIIKQMAQIQINNLMAIYIGEDDEVGLTLREVFKASGKEEDDLDIEIADMICAFDGVIDDPESVGLLDNHNISMVKHILLNFFDDHYRDGDVDYKNVFKQLFDNDNRQAIIDNLNLS